jgi:hypothetical protein
MSDNGLIFLLTLHELRTILSALEIADSAGKVCDPPSRRFLNVMNDLHALIALSKAGATGAAPGRPPSAS